LTELRALSPLATELRPVGVHSGAELSLQDTEWVTVVAPASGPFTAAQAGLSKSRWSGIATDPTLMYDLATVKPGTRGLVIGTDIRPINGQTATALFNVITGEVRDQRSAA
jgi:hypothetical protein